MGEYVWTEFNLAQEDDYEIVLSGPPQFVMDVANGLPEDITHGADVYVDPGDGHYHLEKVNMQRNPDGTWQW